MPKSGVRLRQLNRRAAPVGEACRFIRPGRCPQAARHGGSRSERGPLFGFSTSSANKSPVAGKRKEPPTGLVLRRQFRGAEEATQPKSNDSTGNGPAQIDARSPVGMAFYESIAGDILPAWRGAH